MAFLAASICLEFTQSASSALRPNAPNAKVVPRVSRRLRRVAILCHFLNLTLFGYSIMIKYFSSIYPDFYSQVSIRQMGASIRIVNISAQSLQGHLPLF